MTTKSLLSDQAGLGETVVVIDVFRSSNTVISMLDLGADRVVPVADLSEARNLKKQYPDWLLLAERDGIMIDGADGDNSPTQSIDVSGRSVILTTSAGTQCIAACDNTKKVYMGSFANASALLDQVSSLENSDVSFWASGVRGEIVADEDELCAEFLDDQHKGDAAVDFEVIGQQLIQCRGAARLRERGQLTDLAYCTALNHSETVPVRSLGADGHWWFVRDTENA